MKEDSQVAENLKRNMKLIDLRQIPEQIKTEILVELPATFLFLKTSLNTITLQRSANLTTSSMTPLSLVSITSVTIVFLRC
jgi:hypothetical protein